MQLFGALPCARCHGGALTSDNNYHYIGESPVAEDSGRVVVTHDLTDLDEVVMWISLPAFANRLQNGLNINTALIETATDGLDLPLDVRKALLAQADCLIARAASVVD